MEKARIIAIFVLIIGIVMISLLTGSCASQASADLEVVTSTSLIAQIVDRVGGEKIDVVNIIPPAQCPGHFDIKPGDVQKLADADLFLMHGWQGCRVNVLPALFFLFFSQLDPGHQPTFHEELTHSFAICPGKNTLLPIITIAPFIR